jgi:hypothetical protein
MRGHRGSLYSPSHCFCANLFQKQSLQSWRCPPGSKLPGSPEDARNRLESGPRPRRDLNPCYRRERTTTISKSNDLQEAGGHLSPCKSVHAERSTYRNPYRRLDSSPMRNQSLLSVSATDLNVFERTHRKCAQRQAMSSSCKASKKDLNFCIQVASDCKCIRIPSGSLFSN